MLIELAVGDAYGAGFEYAHSEFVKQHNDVSRYVKHPRHGIKPGCYTDDTQMTLAIAELLIARADWTPKNLAHKFVEVFKRDPREGYASRFWSFLKQVQDGDDFLEKIIPDSEKSGAAMRAAPIGVLQDTEQVIEYARIQATITHNTPNGINAAIAAALMPHYFIYRHGKKADLGRYLEAKVAGTWSQTWRGKVRSKGWMSVQAAITAVMRNQRLSDLLKDCIAFTGDVDTVATIALAAASQSEEYIQDLPPHLIENLEKSTYGYNYLLGLDTELLKHD